MEYGITEAYFSDEQNNEREEGSTVQQQTTRVF